jgi:hypothetical protein
MEDSTQLSITDLAVIKNVIDLACSRGAIKAEEMVAVGQIYSRLTAFLNAVIAQAEAEQMKTESQGDKQ